jgi:hypothetical protein
VRKRRSSSKRTWLPQFRWVGGAAPDEIAKVNDPIGAVVWGMDTSNVDTVFVAGQAKKRNGQLVGVDLDEIRKMAYDSRDYVVKTSGFKMAEI